MKRVVRKKKIKGAGGRVVKVAAGLVTLAVGAYLLYGKGAKARRSKARQWVKHMAHEVKRHAQEISKENPQGFRDVVDHVVDRYRKMKVVKADELARISHQLKNSQEKRPPSKKSHRPRQG